MKILSKANEPILNILNNFHKSSDCLRRIKYCVEYPVEDGVLLFNILTRELVLLSDAEYKHFFELSYLLDHWFVVPENSSEKEYSNLVKTILNNRKNKCNAITGYTIFTTTDCNARCFYCFELGRSRMPMSNAVAYKTLEYIKDHCEGKPVNLSWFGGEPLMNVDVIDLICRGLSEADIQFTSRMVTNGYLFDSFIVEKAVSNWNIKKVQITLDGTQNVYNKVKAFVYNEGNPFQIVLNNIERLLDHSVNVTIRLNMDMHNAEDLLLLAKELSSRFNRRANLHVYASHIFKEGIPMAQMHTDEEWTQRDEAMCRIEETLDRAGLTSRVGVSKKFKSSHCMADSGAAVTILPDGHIGLCEHYTETEFIGHLDKDGFDQGIVASWKERTPEIPECAECFYYPQCIKLKKCSNSSECYPQYRTNIYRNIQRQMRNEYEKWKLGLSVEESDDLITEF